MSPMDAAILAPEADTIPAWARLPRSPMGWKKASAWITMRPTRMNALATRALTVRGGCWLLMGMAPFQRPGGAARPSPAMLR